MTNPAPIVIVAGPTASGKSALAVDLAEIFSGSVINADSMQVYAELRVVTARPDAAAEARVPHRLFGVLPAMEPCSAGCWLEMATVAIAEARADGRLPIVVGGTGMYLKVLMEGLAPVPKIPEPIRAEARARHAELGGDALRDALAELDPAAAKRLPAADGQRLIRAYEVVRATGRPLAEWQNERPPGPSVPGRFITIALEPTRDTLYQAAECRFDAIMAAGALDEVGALAALHLDPELPIVKALGVPELSRHLSGELTLEEATAKAKQATRNFAKRQLTWLRQQMAPDYRIESLYSADARGPALDFLLKALTVG